MNRSTWPSRAWRLEPRHVAVACTVALLAAAALWPAAPATAAGARLQEIPPAALSQIAALTAEKAARTPAQQKIDSNLLQEYRESQGLPSAIATLETGVNVDAAGLTRVDITAFVDDGYLARLQALGATVISAHPAFRSVRADVPVAALETIAAWSETIFVQPEQQGAPAGNARAHAARPSFAQRAERVRAFLQGALRQQGEPGPGESDVTTAAPAQPLAAEAPAAISAINRSEGDVAHRANLARATYGYTGAGVKVCVMSDGVNTLANLQASGDLPPNVTVVPGQAGSGNEGSAMLEIVHDLAPGAQLFYATAAGGIASFAQNILTLRNTYACDIIIDDYTYFAESPFQLGQGPGVISTVNAGRISESVNQVTADGALFFSSAGNSGNLNDGTSGVWEGDFVNGGAVAAPLTGVGAVHDFDPGAGVVTYNTITAGNSNWASLWWADPLGGSNNDYDLFILNSTGTSVLGSSTNVQNGSQDPYEAIPGGIAAGRRIVVVQRTGAANRYLHINTNRGALTYGTAGQVYGHNAAVDAYTTAAANAQKPPVLFGPGTPVETFSSDGPRRHFFNSNGTPFTPGNFSSSGGVAMQKPDLTAADGVSCAAPGFSTFFGTSAAAPHAGAIAALLRSANPALTPAQIRTILTTAPAAIDIESPGVDRDSGAGVLDALAAMQQVNPAPQALLALGAVSFSEGALRNGNGFVEPGESGNLLVPLINASLAGAANVTLTLSLVSPPAGVKLISADTVAYGSIASNSTVTNTGAPYVISVAPTVGCGTSVAYQLTATYGGTNSPQVFNGTFTIGKTFDITTTLDAVAPPSEPGLHTATSGAQTGRLNRNSVISVCGAPKAAPPLQTATGSRQYDAFTLTNALAVATCVTVVLDQLNSAPLFSAAYTSGGFVPATPTTNYLADPGTSQIQSIYSFNVPAGQSFSVVVHEVDPGAGVGSSYRLRINGVGVGKCDAPPPQPTTINVTAGNGQSTVVGTAFATQLQATVRDASNAPVPGVEVAFSAPGSGASGTFPNGNTAITDANGRASVSFVANGTTGGYAVSANTTNPALGAAASFTLTNLAAISITPGALLGATVLQPYSQGLAATGGSGSGYSFAVTSGALPPGLTLSAAGALSGTPSTSGVFNFSVTATDSLGFTGTRAYVMTVGGSNLHLPIVIQ